MEEPKRYSCGNGEGMFDSDKGYWISYKEHQEIVNKTIKLLDDWKVNKHKQELMAEELFILKDIKKSPLKIDLKWWQHTCGDRCCYTDGMDIFLNDEKLDEQNAEDSKNALTAILTKLGYKVEINCY